MKTRWILSLSLAVAAACAPDAQTPEDGSGGSGGAGDGSGGGVGNPGKGGTTGKGGSTGAGGTTATGAGGSGGATVGNGGSGGMAAAGGSGGKADAGPAPDMGQVAPDMGGPVASCSSAKFCDDFEGQAANKAPTGMFKVEGGGSVTVDDTKGFNSKQSVLVKGGGYPGTWLTFTEIATKIPSNDLHGRAMIWMSATPGAAHFDTIMASGPLSGGGNATYILGGMNKKFMSVYHPGDCSVDSSTPFPVGRWACIQWEFKGSKDGTHLHKMMMDGQVVNNGEQNGSQGFCVQGGKRDWKAPTFSTLKIGHVQYGGAGGVQLWIDDLAFGEQPIPCPTAN